MKSFKFGGASVKNAEGVKNVASIVKLYPKDDIIIVVSAMGKITNALEKLADNYFNRKETVEDLIAIRDFHLSIAHQLFPQNNHPVYGELSAIISGLENALKKSPGTDYDFEYDQIVCIGEILSTKIVCAFLNDSGLPSLWFDARDLIKADTTYRDAKVNWEATETAIDQRLLSHFVQSKGKRTIALTQGFIGQTPEGHSVTLGRDGSDYSTAILAYVLDAEEVIIWKDVAGVLNADPRWFDETILLERISYHDAIELAYYGATVIHPKTIKPLQNKQIPLWVKSFLHPNEKGTLIKDDETKLTVPSFIFKVNQALITISPKDFSFIVEENLRDIFRMLSDLKIKINVMQNTALSFSLSADDDDRKIPLLISRLKKKFKVFFNSGLELITIRHYDQSTIDRVCVQKEVLLEQKSRHTVQLVVKPLM